MILLRPLLWKILRMTLMILLGTAILVAIAMPDYVRAQAMASPTSPAEWLLFQPSRLTPENWEKEVHANKGRFFNSADGTKLHGAWFPADNPRAVILQAHGNAGHLGHRLDLAEQLRDRFRVSVFLFDYRGYGLSEGTASVAGALGDARAAREQAAQLGRVSSGEVVLLGRSLGGALVAQLAAEQAPRGLIIESSFRSLQEVVRVHFPRLAWVASSQKLDTEAALHQYSGPLLLSHGDADRTIPYAHGQAVFAAAAGKKEFVTVAGGDHNSPQSEAYWLAFDGFLRRLSATK